MPRNSPFYIIRFDDVCPTMNWAIWEEIEMMLIQYEVRPIIAVIPENQDPKLEINIPIPDFWERVRAWQSRGWSIALHGWQHSYSSKEGGILQMTFKSEFAGHPRHIQEDKLRKGLKVFSKEKVRADCWVAPSHSFDWTTVDLLAELGIRVISDGLWPWPHMDERGIVWVPQQLWGGKRPYSRGGLKEMPAGIWTVCHHHNTWGDRELEQFRCGLEEYAPAMIGLEQAVEIGRERRLTFSDRLHAWQDLIWTHRIRPAIARLIKGSY